MHLCEGTGGGLPSGGAVIATSVCTDNQRKLAIRHSWSASAASSLPFSCITVLASHTVLLWDHREVTVCKHAYATQRQCREEHGCKVHMHIADTGA